MNLRPLTTMIALAGSALAQAQPGTGTTWNEFGPDRASGAFHNITREHLSSQNAYGVAVDRQHRVLVLNEWRETGNTNIDCYSGSHTGVGYVQAFNHDAYNIPVDLTDFGQPAGPYDACAIDHRGRQRSIGNPNASPSTCQYDNSGVNEPAVDIGVTGSRFATATATATGRVRLVWIARQRDVIADQNFERWFNGPEMRTA